MQIGRAIKDTFRAMFIMFVLGGGGSFVFIFGSYFLLVQFYGKRHTVEIMGDRALSFALMAISIAWMVICFIWARSPRGERV